MEYRKVPSEIEIAEWLNQGQLGLAPLRLMSTKFQPLYDGKEWDFEVEAEWGDQKASFAVEYKALSTPKAFEQALWKCRSFAATSGVLPMLMLPFLRPTQLDELEQSGISGIDFCGNGVVIVPGKIRVFRTGNRNQFATYAPIKNIYRKNTSMVARLLLIRSRFSSVQEILDETNLRDLLARKTGKTQMSLGTVSKALKEMENELIVDRSKGIRVLQPDKLLDQLEKNYKPEKDTTRLRVQVDCAFPLLPQYLSRATIGKDFLLVATGLSSASRYATMQREEVLSLYCPDLKAAQNAIGGKETDRFPNVELIQTNEQPQYFDARPDTETQPVAGFYWASPVQTYLELMQGDKRDRETADQVRDYLLRSQGDNNE